MSEAAPKPRAPLPCPVCGKPMSFEREYYGVEVDVCEEHGLWLDATRMKTILNRAIADLETYYSRAVSEAERESRYSWWWENW